MARARSVKDPHLFHLVPLKLSCRMGLLNNYFINLEVRELMKIYRCLKGRIENNILEDIEKFLNSLAEGYGYTEFNIDERITTKNLGVKHD